MVRACVENMAVVHGMWRLAFLSGMILAGKGIHRMLKQFVVLPEDMKIKFFFLIVGNHADAALVDAIHGLIEGFPRRWILAVLDFRVFAAINSQDVKDEARVTARKLRWGLLLIKRGGGKLTLPSPAGRKENWTGASPRAPR
jgi:hypothetical protein